VRGKLSIVPAYTQDGMDDFFAGIDVLLFPSQWKKSFGLTVRVALARDVWVIATEGGGPAEAIMDYAMQAETLRAILARVALGATVSGTP